MLRSKARGVRRLIALGMLVMAPGLAAGGTAAPAAPAAPAAQGRLPTVESVLERYVDAIGGREALLRHKSMTVHGRYDAPAAKLEARTVAYTGGGKLLEIAMLPSGKSISGYDGHTAWDLDSHGNVTIHRGDEVRSIARDADMYYHLHVMHYFRSLDVLDVRSFNGRRCYHLRGINNWGRQDEQFYDTETGLLLGYAFNTAWRGGKGNAIATLEDYRDFGGVRLATKITTRDGDSLSVLTIISVSYDDVPDSMFELPEVVRAKLKE